MLIVIVVLSHHKIHFFAKNIFHLTKKRITMFDTFLNKLSINQKGTLLIVLGLILVLGALGKLGFLQDCLNLILVVVGLFLFYQGARATNLWSKCTHLLKGKK